MTRKGTIPAVAYYRMSHDRQEASIPAQRVAVEQYAEQHGYKILREYEDQGISGDKTSKRMQFQQLITDADKGSFQAILCWDQDRFGRFDSIEMGHWIYPLRRAGVRLVTVAQGEINWNDFAGRLIYTIQQEGKHQFLRDLARNTLRGQIERAKTGVWVAGTPPYGYEVGPDEKLVFGDPSKVEVVRRIFSLRLGGIGTRKIARILNSEGITSPGGTEWSAEAVRVVMTRETYCGVVTLGGRRQGKYFTTNGDQVESVVKNSRRHTNPFRFENAHPAIIDRETFDAVQKIKLREHRAHWRMDSEGAPLGGLLYCGHCGKVMYAQSLHTAGGQKYPNYICSTYHKSQTCGYHVVKQDAILRVVAEKLRQHFLMGSIEGLERAVARELDRRQKQNPSTDDQRRMRQQLDTLDRQIEQATERIVTVDNSLVADVEKKLLELKERRVSLTMQLRPPKQQADKLDARQIASRIWELDKILEKEGPAKVRQALSQIIKRISLEFRFVKRHARGQKFEFAKGTIELCTMSAAYPATTPRSADCAAGRCRPAVSHAAAAH